MRVTIALVMVAMVVGVSASFASAPPRTCTWKYGTYEYDLTSLWRQSGDYKTLDTSTGYTILMNVCGPVSEVKCADSLWYKGIGVCLLSYPTLSFAGSWGEYNPANLTDPVWSRIGNATHNEGADAGVQLNFISGDVCWIGGQQVTRQTRLRLRCSETTESTFTVEDDKVNCISTLTMKAAVACPVGGGSTIVSAKYTDPDTKAKWDLTSLDSKLYDYITEYGAYNYTMNVCDLTTKAGKCRELGNSICQYNYKSEFFAGLGGIRRDPPGQWSLIAGDPSVGIKQTFTNGDDCWVSGKQVPRTSIISFYCDPTGPRTFTVTEDAATCVYNFKFSVAEGCPTRS